MKTTLLTLLAFISISSFGMAGNFFGAAPFANEGYWPGYLNGKYSAVVTGNNIAGVLGFGIVDGAPPFRENDQQSSSGGLNPVALVNTSFAPDPLQNYFAIFVEGVAYTGTTWAGINLADSTISGALQGAGLSIGVPQSLANNVSDALSVVNRGLSGGFTANINSKKASFTFTGNGQLSTPANNQTIILNTVPTAVDSLVNPLVPANTITNEVISGRIVTETTPFTLSGIRTSFSANNPAAVQDALNSQGGGGN